MERRICRLFQIIRVEELVILAKIPRKVAWLFVEPIGDFREEHRDLAVSLTAATKDGLRAWAELRAKKQRYEGVNA